MRPLLLAGILLASALPSGSQSVPRFVTTLRPFSATGLSGRSWTLASLKGKTTYVDVWATWCKPCHAEHPVLERLHRKLQETGAGQVLTISVDEDPAIVEAYMKENGYTFPVIVDHRISDANFASAEIPASFLVNREGVRTGRYLAPTEASFQAILDDIGRSGR